MGQVIPFPVKAKQAAKSRRNGMTDFDALAADILESGSLSEAADKVMNIIDASLEVAVEEMQNR